MKKWNNISDNELDSLFKKAAESIDPVFEAEAWDQMAQKLDSESEKPKTFGRGGFLIGGAILLLLLGTLGGRYYFGQNNNFNPKEVIKSEGQNIVDKGTTQSKEVNKSSLVEANTKETTATDQKENEVNTRNEQTESDLRNNPASNGLTLNSKSKNLSTTETTRSGSNKEIPNEKGKSLVNAKKESKSETKISNPSKTLGKNNTRAYKDRISTNFDRENDQSLERVNQEQSELKNSIPVSRPLEDLNFLEIEGKTFQQMETDITFSTINVGNQISDSDQKQKVKKLRPIYLTFGISPDFSKVVKNSFVKMGSNLSAQLEYHLNDKWSIHTGAIVSNKFYNSDANGMYWPKYWGSMPKELTGMDGSCSVIDIPLNLRYNLKSDEKAKMYLVTGLSSFVFIGQKYSYIYSEGMDPNQQMKPYVSSKREFLPAGMLNFSIGYERKLTNNFSFQIEPFVKGTIRDFGFSQVKLVSSGVFFTGKVKLK